MKYPDDGGLGPQRRPFGEGFNPFKMILEHFTRPKEPAPRQCAAEGAMYCSHTGMCEAKRANLAGVVGLSLQHHHDRRLATVVGIISDLKPEASYDEIRSAAVTILDFAFWDSPA